jgi:DNA-binding transcriptional MocR family regulator
MDRMDTATARFRDLLGNWAAGSGPTYLRLSAAIREVIDDGLLDPGARLPAERALAAALSVSRSTVVTAYNSLRRDGVVISRQGSGTRVRPSGSKAPARPDDILARLGRNQFFRGLIDETPVKYDLASAPATATLIADLLRDAAADAFSEMVMLASDHGYAPLGLPALRAEIARDLRARGLPTAPQQILVTNGAQQATMLAAAAVATRGGTVIVDDPTSVGALDAFAAAELQPVGIPVGADGPDLELLHAAAQRAHAQLAYLSATFQNPTGVVMTTPARRALITLATELRLPLVEDMSLADLSLSGSAPTPLAALDKQAQVMTIGSLSNIVWGGLRVGWLRAPAATVARLARFKTAADIGTSLIAQLVAVHLLPNLDEVRTRRREALERAADLTTELLRELVPEWSWREPRGGPFFWIELPTGSASTFAQVAMRHGVSVIAGPLTSAAGNYDRHIRLRFADEPDLLREALRQLATAWRAYSADAADTSGPAIGSS